MKVKLIAIILFSLLLSFQCARFRIEELEPSIIVSLQVSPSGKPNRDQNLQGMKKGQVPYNFPIKPVTDGSYIYVADPGRRLVRIFSSGSGKLNRLIGANRDLTPEDIKFVKVPNLVPGWVTADEDGNYYIEYHQPAPGTKPPPIDKNPTPESLGPERRLPGIFNTADRKIATSVIYQFNEDDKLKHILGVQGPPGKPFGAIHRMDAGPDGTIYVCHRVGNKKVLSIYRNGVLLKTYNGVNVSDKERKKYYIDVEELAPNIAANFVIAAVAFRDKKTYKPLYRKIYRLQNPDAPPQEVYRTEDLDDFFAWSRPDGGFYLINTEDDSSSILFKIFSNEGEYLNNRLIRFPDLRNAWRETYLTLDGRILSSRLFRGNLELWEWK